MVLGVGSDVLDLAVEDHVGWDGGSGVDVELEESFEMGLEMRDGGRDEGVVRTSLSV